MLQKNWEIMQKSEKKILSFTHNPVPKDALSPTWAVCLTMWSSWGCKHLSPGGWLGSTGPCPSGLLAPE